MATYSKSTQLHAVEGEMVTAAHRDVRQLDVRRLGSTKLLASARDTVVRADGVLAVPGWEWAALQGRKSSASSYKIGLIDRNVSALSARKTLLNPFMTVPIFRVCSLDGSVANSARAMRRRADRRGSDLAGRYPAAVLITEPVKETHNHMGQDSHLAQKLNLQDRLERHCGAVDATLRSVASVQDDMTGARP